MEPLSANFKHLRGQQAYLDAYAQTMQRWPVPHHAWPVETRFGVTQVNMAGAAGKPPLVLLHGYGFSSTQWYCNIGALSEHFYIYAPDVVDQFGRSVPSRGLAGGKNYAAGENYAAWLGEVLDCLRVERAAFAGHSYGGWIALNLALSTPQRVERLALLSPAASFQPMRKQFYLRGMLAALLPLHAVVRHMVNWMTTRPDLTRDEPVVEQFVLGMKYGKQLFQPGFPSVFTDEQLGSLKMPVLLLVGEKEVIYDPQAALQRARATIPQIEAEILPGGGHAFPMDQPERTNERLLKFLRS